MSKILFRFLVLNCGWMLAFCAARTGASAQTNTNTASPAAVSATGHGEASSDESLRAYLQLQEQMHEAVLQLERNREQAENATARTAKELGDRLQTIEKALASQQESLAAQRLNASDTNRTLLIVVSAFAALGCFAVLLTTYFQWRAVHGFTSASLAFGSGALALGGGVGLPALGSGDGGSTGGAIEQSDRLLGAIERLEQRIQQLERGSRPAVGNGSGANNILDLEPATGSGDTQAQAGNKAAENSRLVQGQTLLNQGKLDEAAACFDEVLATDPSHAEALVKKGTVFERMRKPQEALDCYDRAIASDATMTIAYLYKGGLFNRLERFSEALACYEQALHTQEKRRAG